MWGARYPGRPCPGLFSCRPSRGFPDRSRRTLMIERAIPVLSVTDCAKAETYYCNILGFQKMFAYRPDPNRSDPCYLGVARDGVWLHLESFKPERAGLTGAVLCASDVDQLYPEFS